MEETLTDLQLAAWRAFLEAHRGLIDRLAAELDEQRHLPLTWYDVLVNLQEHDGRLRMAELAHRVVLSPSGLSRLVDRMADASLVAREQVESDRRGTWVVMTDEGWSALQAAGPIHIRGVAAHFGRHMDEDEAAVLHRVLQRISASLDRPDDTPGS